MAVEEAAVSLGVSLPNCVLVSRGASRRREQGPGKLEVVKAVEGLKISKVGSEEGKEEQKKLAGKYCCQVCDFTSNLPSQVKEHGRTDHLGKVFVCPKCKKRYSKKRVLKRHLEEKHGDGLEVKAEPGTQEDTINDMADKTREDNSVKVKNYFCKVCSKAFFKQSNLNVHMNIHLENKPFPCSKLCGLAFTQKGNMQSHVKKIHSEEDKHFEGEVIETSMDMSENEKDTSEEVEEHEDTEDGKDLDQEYEKRDGTPLKDDGVIGK